MELRSRLAKELNVSLGVLDIMVHKQLVNFWKSNSYEEYRMLNDLESIPDKPGLTIDKQSYESIKFF